jgi:sporulation protein YlmC with PRC-barrel domain
MKTLMTTSAILALLSLPVFAQGDNADQMQVQPPAATDIAPGDTNGAPAASGDVQKAPDAAAPDTTAAAPAAKGDNAVAAAKDQQFIAQQGENQNLVSEWIGKTVYNANDENLGDVNDLVIADNGSANAVIIGVGGFLGIGEKNVAVPFDAVQPRTDENGKLTLYLEATKDQLDAAPEFKTLADIKAEERANTAATQPTPAQQTEL